MSSIDDVIRERLQKLKTSDPNTSNPAGTSTSSGAKAIPITKSQKASACEQVEDLLAQLSSEINLEAQIKRSEDIDTEIRSRLQKLKSREGCNFSSRSTVSLVSSVINDDEINDEDFFKKSSCSELLNLSDNSGIDSDKSCDSNLSDSEDLDNLCIVCDKTPSLICLGCDKDYYCKSCFKQFHSFEEVHKTVPYLTKKLTS